MPTDEGRRRKQEAELYQQTERQNADEARRASEQRLKGFHRAVDKNIERREKAIQEIRKRYGIDQ